LIELPSFKQIMRGASIQMRQSTSVTSCVSIDYFAVEFLERVPDL
jgi:hypothetical protein